MSKYEGLTVDEAIQNGLKALNVTRQDVEVTIITEGKKGFLGLGKKAAVVALTPLKSEKKPEPVVTPKVETKPTKSVEPVSLRGTKELENLSDDDAITELALYLTEITQNLDAPALVKVERQKSVITFHLESDKPGMLIGKHGKVLNAFQYLAQVFVHRAAKNKLSIVVNVGDYRERRAATLERLASNTANRVKRTGQPVFLEPMPAFERKQIHAILSSHPEVSTHSEGDEPFRYLVVELKKN